MAFYGTNNNIFPWEDARGCAFWESDEQQIGRLVIQNDWISFHDFSVTSSSFLLHLGLPLSFKCRRPQRKKNIHLIYIIIPFPLLNEGNPTGQCKKYIVNDAMVNWEIQVLYYKKKVLSWRSSPVNSAIQNRKKYNNPYEWLRKYVILIIMQLKKLLKLILWMINDNNFCWRLL